MENSEIQERKPKKKRSKFVRRLRAFWHNLCRLPAKTLIIAGGTIAVILVAIILLVVLLPGKEVPAEPEVSETPEIEVPVYSEMPTFTPEPVVTPAPASHPLEGVGKQGSSGWYLSLNDKADVVADIQTRLVELGYMETPVIDGVAAVTTTYGPATRLAVQKFQAVNGLELDGCVGMSTYDLLMGGSAKPLQLNRTSSSKIFETDITKLQTRLQELGFFKSTVNGKYGTPTMEAVQAFQNANGLKADGIAGSATLALVYSDDAKGAE